MKEGFDVLGDMSSFSICTPFSAIGGSILTYGFGFIFSNLSLRAFSIFISRFFCSLVCFGLPTFFSDLFVLSLVFRSSLNSTFYGLLNAVEWISSTRAHYFSAFTVALYIFIFLSLYSSSFYRSLLSVCRIFKFPTLWVSLSNFSKLTVISLLSGGLYVAAFSIFRAGLPLSSSLSTLSNSLIGNFSTHSLYYLVNL